MYRAVEIANYFIKLSKEQNKPIDNMKLQKLVYIAHGYYLATNNDYLIDEAVQAWEYGPVINSLYHAFKQYGSGYVVDYYTENTGGIFKKIPIVKESDKQVCEFLDLVWDAYVELSGIQLSNLTHSEGSPWTQTYEKYSSGTLPKGATIEPHIIKSYYQDKLDQQDG